jgi:hypothetical protein
VTTDNLSGEGVCFRRFLGDFCFAFPKVSILFASDFTTELDSFLDGDFLSAFSTELLLADRIYYQICLGKT